MSFLSEAFVEQALLEQLRGLGYGIECAKDIGPDGQRPERESHDEVVLKKRFESAVALLNPGLPLEARQDAIRKLTQTEFPTLLEENCRIHKLLTEGVYVEYYERDGTLKVGKVNFINFEQPEQNDWLAVSQFVVINGQNNRQPDVVVFVNGLPIADIELKTPTSEQATLESAFNQLQTYKTQIPALFNTNGILLISDGLTARLGSLSANFERFMPWRTIDGAAVMPKGKRELPTLIEGVFEHRRLLDLLCNFTVFGKTSSGLTKIIAGYHQFEYYRAFIEDDVTAIIAALESSVETVGGILLQEGPGEDVPVAFDGTQLSDHLEILAEQENSSQFVDFLVLRIRMLLSNTRMRSTISNSCGLNLDDWLGRYIGDNQASNGSITVIDLSLVPAEVVHIITAVIARMTLEALQRYRRLHKGKTLPTVLVMEEAHTFIKRYHDDAENQNSAAICCQVFEKIAREGRKFGLGLVLSSQRPSELSPTVLSQCNSYLLHRISNDRDQELVHKLVPDNLRGLLRDLPSLPSRHAILLGWASELPVLVQMNPLPEHHRPKSNDPDFWDVWSGKDKKGEKVDRPVNWKAIANDWQQISSKKRKRLKN